jgi:hypothetical protein
MRASLRLLITILAVAALAPQAWAHHAFQPQFDLASPIVLSGAVVSTDWRSPHTVIHLTGSEAGQPARDWLIETRSPAGLLKLGLTREALAPGAMLIVRAFRATACPQPAARAKGACKAKARALIFDNGRTVALGSDDCGPRDTIDMHIDHPCTPKSGSTQRP